MDLSYTPAQETLRRELRTWLRRNLPRGDRDGRSVEYGDPARVPAARACPVRGSKMCEYFLPAMVVNRS